MVPPTDAAMDCTAHISAGSMPRDRAAVSCSEPNRILELVLLPVIKAPSMPMSEAIKGYPLPVSSTIPVERIVVIPPSIMMDAVQRRKSSVISVGTIFLMVF